MDNALMIGLSAQQLLRRRMDATANNLANLNTTGFKSESLVMREISERPARAVDRPEDIVFPEEWTMRRNMEEGSLRHTGAGLDIAIRGQGFLVVEGPGGREAYSRDGRLGFNADGELVTHSGWPLLDESGQRLVVDPEKADTIIGKDGSIRQDGQETGRLYIVGFNNPAALEKSALGLWFASAESPQDIADPDLAPGYLEQSNVNAIFELTQMIEISRSYQNVSRLVAQSDELRRDAISRLASAGTTS